MKKIKMQKEQLKFFTNLTKRKADFYSMVEDVIASIRNCENELWDELTKKHKGLNFKSAMINHTEGILVLPWEDEDKHD